MPEPTSTAATAATLLSLTLAPPVLSIAGVSLGLRPDVLLAGFSGAVAAMALLNTVPATGDTWRELLRTSLRRVGVALASAATAGYMAPLLSLIDGTPGVLLLSVAFGVGAGAQTVLASYIERLRGRALQPAPNDQAGGGAP